MYLPRHFANADLARLHDLIETRMFGLLIVAKGDQVDAAHIPFVLDRVAPVGAPINEPVGVTRDCARGAHDYGRLRGHFARANPIWRACDGTAEALAVFAGPDTYISPDWYVTPHQVPTWNYIAVHAAGRPKVVNDEAQVRRLLEDLSARSEARLPAKKPWAVDKLPAEIYERMIKGIVAFEMPIDRIEGKWKLSQNRTEEDRRGVVAALETLDDANARAVAKAMRKL
jgi:transcriptional regulator